MNKWTVEVLNETVRAELKSLPADVNAKLKHIIELIAIFGLENVHEPYIKHIEGKIWEMRMKGKDNIGRALYVTAKGKRVVILHAFIKKTQKTPNKAKKLAQQRLKELKE
jgi:phage-related protein